MSKSPFQKFINPDIKGAKKKEAIRQAKRKQKEEARQRGEEYRRIEAEKYQAVGTRYGNTPEQREAGKGKTGAGSKQSAVGGRQSAPGGRQPAAGSKQAVAGKEMETARSSGKAPAGVTEGADMPLNKFIAHAGICGRREAAELVKQGKVTVNGDIIFEPGYKVRGNEDVKVNGKKIFSQKNLVYILVNKPKDYLTTLKDPEGRKTVMDLVKAATKERVYPVGRLDRNTTGVLLLTNDGELAQKLTHPSFEIKKIYEVKLDRPVLKKDLDAILEGITLEDGFIKADAVSYADSKDKSGVGIEIHSGRNRIVRRIFEHLGYDVKNLDRVMFANLTKKNVDRGKWRFLNEKELRLLKYMNQSFVRAKHEKEQKEVDEILASEKPAAKKKSAARAGSTKKEANTTTRSTSAPRRSGSSATPSARGGNKDQKPRRSTGTASKSASPRKRPTDRRN